MNILFPEATMGLLTTGQVKGKRIVVNIITRHVLIIILDRFSIFLMFMKNTCVDRNNQLKKKIK